VCVFGIGVGQRLSARSQPSAVYAYLTANCKVQGLCLNVAAAEFQPGRKTHAIRATGKEPAKANPLGGKDGHMASQTGIPLDSPTIPANGNRYPSATPTQSAVVEVVKNHQVVFEHHQGGIFQL